MRRAGIDVCDGPSANGAARDTDRLLSENFANGACRCQDAIVVECFGMECPPIVRPIPSFWPTATGSTTELVQKILEPLFCEQAPEHLQ
jgi:hypothetical protein